MTGIIKVLPTLITTHIATCLSSHKQSFQGHSSPVWSLSPFTFCQCPAVNSRVICFLLLAHLQLRAGQGDGRVTLFVQWSLCGLYTLLHTGLCLAASCLSQSDHSTYRHSLPAPPPLPCPSSCLLPLPPLCTLHPNPQMPFSCCSP